MKLQEAEEAVKDDVNWLDLNELKKDQENKMLLLRINPIVVEDLKNIAEDNMEYAEKMVN